MPNKTKLEYKSLNVAIKSFDSIEGKFKGYASAFGKIDAVNDTILPKSYDSSIALWGEGNAIPVNYDHYSEIILADNLTSISTDETGLLVEFTISQESRETYSELFGKIVLAMEENQLFMSIGGFITKSSLGDDRWIKKEVANANDTIEEFVLDHIAITKYPVDSHAKMLEMKSRNKKNDFADIDGEVSATKYLIANKSEMSNTMSKNFVLHLKSIWNKELDIKEKEVKSEVDAQGSEPLCNKENVSEDGKENNKSFEWQKISQYIN